MRHMRMSFAPRLLGVLLTLGLAASAAAQFGTPPPFECGKSYVFGKAMVNGNVVAGTASTVTVNTMHFVERIGSCNATSPTVTMTASLACSNPPNSGPTVFGPFSIGEGITEIPIQVPVPAGPERLCTLVIVSRVTFADGSILEQRGDQFISAGPQSDAQPQRPAFEAEVTNGPVFRVPPGANPQVAFNVRNNLQGQALHVLRTRTTLAAASGMPTNVAGPNNARNGPFSIGDPEGLDAPDHTDGPLGAPCVVSTKSYEQQRHDNTFGSFTDGVVIQPQSFQPFATTVAVPGDAPHGWTAEGRIQVDSHNHVATAGFTIVVDRTVAAQLTVCDRDRVRPAIAGVGTNPTFGTITRLQADVSPLGTQTFFAQFALDKANVRLFTNSVEVFGQDFSSSSFRRDGQYFDTLAERSFIPPTPQDAVFTFITPFKILVDPTSATNTQIELKSMEFVDPPPNAQQERLPYMTGWCSVERAGTLADGALRFHHQIQTIGVDDSFAVVPMRIVKYTVVQTDANTYVLTTTSVAANPAERPIIGFDLFGYHRSYAAQAMANNCGDMNGDGRVDAFDIALFIESLSHPGSHGSHRADMNGDGVLNRDDYIAFLEAVAAANRPCGP